MSWGCEVEGQSKKEKELVDTANSMAMERGGGRGGWREKKVYGG